MGIRDWFLPKERDFYQMLRGQSVKTVEGLRALRLFVEKPSPEGQKKVNDIEEEADDLRLHLINELNDSFVTPIDREDIHRLSKAIDDVLDYAKRTANEFMVYQVSATPKAIEIIETLIAGTEELDRAIHHLEKNKSLAATHAAKAKKAENRVEYLYNDALAELFQGRQSSIALADLFLARNTIYILKMREIYRHLSNSADRIDEAADLIHDIAVKFA